MLASDIVNMAHLGPRAFEDIAGEVVQTTSFVFRRTNIPTYAGQYVRLIDFLSERAKEEAFLSGSCRLFSAKSKYALLPGYPWRIGLAKMYCQYIIMEFRSAKLPLPERGTRPQITTDFYVFGQRLMLIR